MNAMREPIPERQLDLARMLGALLLASGAVALFIRKEANDSWADFPTLLVLLIPCALLYGLGIGALDRWVGTDRRDGGAVGLRGAEPKLVGDRGAAVEEDGAEPWRATFVIFALLLVPLVGFQLVELLNGDANAPLNSTWIFLVTAGLAGFAAYRRGVFYAVFVAGIALLIAWLSLWSEILDDPSVSTIRWLLFVFALGLVAVAVVLERAGDRRGPDLVTVAGLAAVTAGVLGFVGAAAELAGQSVRGLGSDGDGIRQKQEWDFYLLIVSLALLWYGTRVARRGPAYVGAFGLLFFTVSVGAELATQLGGDEAKGEAFGWPLLLLLLGAAGLAAGFLLPLRGGGPGGPGGGFGHGGPGGPGGPDGPGGPGGPAAPVGYPPPGGEPAPPPTQPLPPGGETETGQATQTGQPPPPGQYPPPA